MAHPTLTNRRFLVTGASSGIGRELALELARHGARLLLLARSRDKLDVLAREINALEGGRDLPAALICAGDVTDPGVRQQAIHEAQAVFGGLDGLVNNAGIGAFGRFAESDPDRLRRIMEVNFFAAVELTRLCLPLLREGTQPVVVNIGSILGHRAIPRMAEYCAGKFALRGWSESLRVELRPLGVHVLLVSPGTTDTPFYDHAIAGSDQVPWTRSTSVTAEQVARRTVRAILRRRREIVPNLAGRCLVWASRRFPGLLDRYLQKYA